jgi:hypothetical protein
MIVDEAPASEIRDKVFQATQKIRRCDADLDLIGIPGGIGKALDDYDSDTAQVSGSKVANRLFDLGIGQGDKPKRVYLESKTLQYNDVNERTEVICFDSSSDIEDIEDQLYVDVSRMRDVIIKKPMSRILDSLEIDAAAAMRGKKQNSIGDYL